MVSAESGSAWSDSDGCALAVWHLAVGLPSSIYCSASEASGRRQPPALGQRHDFSPQAPSCGRVACPRRARSATMLHASSSCSAAARAYRAASSAWHTLASGCNRWVLKQAMVVEPRDPLQRRQFDRLVRLPRPAPVDDLGPLYSPLMVSAARVVEAVAGEEPHAGARCRLQPGVRCNGSRRTGCHGRCGESGHRRARLADTYSACSSASSTKSVCIELLTRRPNSSART